MLHIMPIIATLACGPSLVHGDAPRPSEAQSVTFHPRGVNSISLEGVLTMPAGAGPFAAAVICHPDPRYGGSMNVPVVQELRTAFRHAGYATLIFNSRGVGGSTGQFDEGEGEVLDCLGALDFLRSRPEVNPKRVALAGYSFGSWVGLRACVKDGKTPACACLAFPVSADEDLTKHAYFSKIAFPTLFVTGDQDEISNLETIRRLIAANRVTQHCQVEAIEGADHFLFDAGHLTTAAKKIVEFIREHLEHQQPQQAG